jgi:TRAP-type mannitol/chloroaromatic compound transport system substrate-binding protein
MACQAAYDDVASDMYANDPRSLQTLVSEHGVQVRRFPDEILEAGAKASAELLGEIRANGDPLTKKVAESFVSALQLLRTRTDGTDSPFLQARERFFTL